MLRLRHRSHLSVRSALGKTDSLSASPQTLRFGPWIRPLCPQDLAKIDLPFPHQGDQSNKVLYEGQHCFYNPNVTGFTHLETKPTQQRRIPRKRRSVSGIYMFRGERAVPYESALERDFIIRTEFFRNIEDIIAQPVQVSFLSENGGRYIYTPDFLIYRRPGACECPRLQKPILVEVKPRESWQQNWRQWSRKWKAAMRYAKERGWEFRIRDESRIRDEAFKNILWLARFKRTEIDDECRERILNDLEELGFAEFDYLLNRHFDRKNVVYGSRHLWALLAQRYIDCNISLPLDGMTEFRVPIDG